MSTREVRGPETGGSTPRSATHGSSTAVAVIGLALLGLSPVGAVVAVGAVWAAIRQVRRHWWEVALVALGATVAAGLIVQLITGDLIAFHFGGYVQALIGEGSWWVAALRTAPVGIPFGVLAGACYIGAAERWSGQAEWHDMEQRRRAVVAAKAERRIAARIADPSRAKLCPSPPLGVLRSGDLDSWTQGDGFVCLPAGASPPAMGLLGESGSGKTVTAERLVTLWARAGRKVIFADFKGSDPDLAARVVAAYKSIRPEALCGLWPAQPLDMWRGSPSEIENRLLRVHEYSEKYYKDAARTIVHLVVAAPDVDGYGPVRDSQAFLARLDGAFLKRAWEGRREASLVAEVMADRKALTGVRLRFEGFFGSLAGRLDHGFSFEDCDLAVLSVPTLAEPEDAMAIARMVLLDFGAYCLNRKPRVGEDVTFIVDEFSAVTEAAPMVITLAERVRDVGGQVVVSAQSYEGLGGDDSERRRMLDALAPGGLIVHRLAEPEEVIKTAGTVRGMEQSWQLEERGSTGLGTVKMAHRLKVDPDEVRQAKTGEAWVITRGRAAHLTVLQNRIDDDMREHARRLVEYARMQAAEDLASGQRPTVQAWWEVRLPNLAELGPGPVPRDELEMPDPLALPPAADPLALPPAPEPPAKLPDPRLVMAIMYYVRAGLIAEARAVAEQAKGIKNPRRYVDRAVERRAQEVAELEQRRRRRRRR